MRVRYISDIHFEFMSDGGREFAGLIPTDCDALVLAGDIGVAHGGSLLKGMRYVLERFQGIPVLYVPGNHEFYSESTDRLFRSYEMGRRKGQEKVRKVCDRLHEDFPHFFGGVDPWRHTVLGQDFVGATMWFGNPPPHAPFQHMADYSYISGFAEWERGESEHHLQYLHNHAHDKSIVITHHLPAQEAVAPRYSRSALNAFFVHPQAHDVMQLRKPIAWIHGHSHDPLRQRLGSTWMLRNPHGYTGHETLGEYKDGLFNTNLATGAV